MTDDISKNTWNEQLNKKVEKISDDLNERRIREKERRKITIIILSILSIIFFVLFAGVEFVSRFARTKNQSFAVEETVPNQEVKEDSETIDQITEEDLQFSLSDIDIGQGISDLGNIDIKIIQKEKKQNTSEPITKEIKQTFFELFKNSWPTLLVVVVASVILKVKEYKRKKEEEVNPPENIE